MQIGLDPSNVTYEAVFTRLVDITAANINFANLMALMGASFFVATLLVRTIVPLRIIGIISNLFFIIYGALSERYRLSCSISCRCRSTSSACVRCSIW